MARISKNLLLFFSIFFCLEDIFPQSENASKKDDILVEEIELNIQEKYENIEPKLSNWNLDEIEKYAVSNNPGYLAEKQNIGIARGELITAALYKNPVFSYQGQFIPIYNDNPASRLPFLTTPSSSGGPYESAPMITQDIDVNGIIEQKSKVAKQAFQAQIANFADFDRIFRLRLRQNYWSHIYITELINFQKEFYENYNDLLKLTKFRAEKGDISQLEYDRLFLERLRIEKEYREADIQRAQIAKELRFLIGISPSNQSLKLKGSLNFKTTSELGLNLKEFNIEDRPDLQASQITVYQNKLNVELKRKEGETSFVNLGAEFRHKGREGYGGIFVSVPLKVYDRNQGEIVKAEEQYKQSILKLESKRKHIYAEVRASIRELNSRENLLINYRNIKLIEKNQEVHEKYTIAYMKGATNLVTFLEAEKNYLSVLRSYYEELYLYYNAIELFRASIGKLGNAGND